MFQVKRLATDSTPRDFPHFDIERTDPAGAIAVEINHRRLDALVPEQFLDGRDVVTGSQRVGRESVSQRVRRDMLLNSSR